MRYPNNIDVTALIADDEPLLRSSLIHELESVWPELTVVSEVANGQQALQRLRKKDIHIAFLDIKMPEMSGLEVARQLVQSWPDTTDGSNMRLLPLMVFVTAYGEFALEAFESAAADYLLKPVNAQRLSLTVSKLQARLHERAANPADIDQSVLQALALQLSQLGSAHDPSSAQTQNGQLTHIRASVGDTVKMIPVDEVLWFEASDKYVVVHSVEGESLIREPLRELSSQLDATQFKQIHRSSIVNMAAVESATRDAHGKLVLTLCGIRKQPVVSRHYAHLFKAM